MASSIAGFRVDSAPGRLRLQKADRLPVLHAGAAVALVVFELVAALGASIAHGGAAFAAMLLMVAGLLRLSRVAGRGTITRVERSLEVVENEGGYRDARERWLVVDGARFPAREIRDVRILTVSQAGRAPDIDNLYVAFPGRAVLVAGAQRGAQEAERLAAIVAGALELPAPRASSGFEPVSGGGVAFVLLFLLLEVACSGAAIGTIVELADASGRTSLALAAAVVVGRIALHALAVVAFGAGLRGMERKRAAAMFGVTADELARIAGR